MQFHPNFICIMCFKPEEIRSIAEIMKADAERDPDKIEGYGSAGSEEAAREVAKEIGERMVESGKLRFIWYEGLKMNLVCTLREDKGKKEWNLSMSVQGMPPGRVPDPIAKIIADAFFEKDYKEIETQAVWKTIRHFVKDY